VLMPCVHSGVAPAKVGGITSGVGWSWEAISGR
jgi:hypothetical protein